MKMKLFYALVFLSLVSTIHAQQKIRLVNNWEFIKQDLGGVWESVRSIGKNPEAGSGWQKVNLPHCVNALDGVDPDVHYYQGAAWYHTLLDVQNPYKNGRTLLHFEGAGQKTDVYVYTAKLGSHIGGYDEWTVDITDAVEAFIKDDSLKKQFKGKIPVSIRTDNSRDLEMIPSDLSDFNINGGIYRYLNLVYLPVVSIEKLFVDAKVDSSGTFGSVSVKARLYNPQNLSNLNFELSLIDPLGKVVSKDQDTLLFSGGDVILSKSKVKTQHGQGVLLDIPLYKPELWSTDLPKLYTIEVRLKNGEEVYTQSEKIGFRHFEFVKNGPFKLNGKRLLIRGTQRHEDHAGIGAAMTEDLMRKEMLLMKEMGVNFIRLAHYQQSRIILNLCDSLGILVWEEIPWCRGGLGGERYKQQARNMLTNMIEQHYNHPSIILWGLGNENDWPGDFEEFDKNKIRAFMKELNDMAHHLDLSRKTSIRRCDFCKDIVDVYSPSIWAGWYRGIYTEYKQVTEEEFKKVDHFIHMEWGGDSHAGRHSENPDKALQNIKAQGAADERAGDALLFGGAARVSKDGDWSESYICNLFDWHLKEQETMPWLTGAAQWIFKDFASPGRPENPVPNVNQKGLLERDMTKKEGYYVFQSYWATKPMAHIYGHSWPVRWGNAGEEKMVKVYSNCNEAELFVNGKSYGVKKRNSQDFPAAGLRWNVVFQEGVNRVSVVARNAKAKAEAKSKVKMKVEDEVRDEISFEYQTAKWGRPAKAILEKLSEENGIATVQVKLYD
ncbi:MAG: glycoside hydrolase family 2 protein, partial [Flavisolibacter sp.]